MKKVLLILTAIFLLFQGVAYAVPCSDSDSGIFICTSDDPPLPDSSDPLYVDCWDGIGVNDNAGTLNDNNVFGFSTWELLSKSEFNDDTDIFALEEPVPVDIGLTVSSSSSEDALFGTFSFDADIWLSYDYITIALKGPPTLAPSNAIALSDNLGSGPAWSAYLLEEGVSEGCWQYGINAKSRQLADLSHLSVYGTPGPSIPEPATMLLLGSGLIGLVAFGRKRFRNN